MFNFRQESHIWPNDTIVVAVEAEGGVAPFYFVYRFCSIVVLSVDDSRLVLIFKIHTILQWL